MRQLKTPYTPEDAAFDSSRLPVLNRFFQTHIDNKRLIGASYALSRDLKMFAAAALGRQCYREDDKRQLEPDTIFRTASVTKLFTAAAIFKLVEDGLCRLDEPMKLYLNELDTEEFSDITIAQALSHTGGLPVDGGVYGDDSEGAKPNTWELIEKEFSDGGTDWVSAGLRAGRTAKAGKRWEYSSFGYSLLGEVITRISGVMAEKYIEESILTPCGMSDSGFWDTVIKIPDFSKRCFIHFPESEEALSKTEEDNNPWAKVPSTGGGIHSTVTDLIRFGNMLLNGGRLDGKRVLGRLAIQKMISEHSRLPNFCWGAPGAPKYYGYGPELIMDDTVIHTPGTYSHEGWGRCHLSIDPAERFVMAYFIPLTEPNEWDPVTSYNPQAIINSGII